MNDIASNALALLGSLPPPDVSQFGAGLAVLAFSISLASRHSLTVAGTVLAIVVVVLMLREMQSLGALAIGGFAVLYALGGFERRAHQIRLRRIEHSIQAMSGLVDVFLDGLERRTREQDRALSAVVLDEKIPVSKAGHVIAAE